MTLEGGGDAGLLIVAVEASADLHGAAVLRELRALHPSVRAFGAAGPHLRAEGCEALVRAEDLSVMGILEVLPAIPRILRALSALRRAAEERRPRAALLIDSPDFNLRLARKLRARGVPVVYFIGPSVWAWRTYRVRRIARDVLRMLVILPFEAAFYARHGVRAVYVGNPLADELRGREAAALPAVSAGGNPDRGEAAAGGGAPESVRERRRALGLDPDRPVLALLPGSRRQEIRRLWRPLLGAARTLCARRPGLQVVVPVAPTIPRALLEPMAREAGLDVAFVAGRAPEVLACADVAAVASGTAALEAALAQVPAVVVYRLSWLSWLIARLLVRVRFAALPNLLAGRALVPELLQRECTSERIAEEVEALLEGGGAREAQLAGLRALRAELTPPGSTSAARKAAEELLAVLEGPR
jgi:lipid-A-disaccharide synthase